MSALKKIAGFIYAESGLVTSKTRIELALSRHLGVPVRLKRFYKGRGWGLKYLVFSAGRTEPDHLVKAASRVIEARLKKALGKDYVPFDQRFSFEARVLNSLAEIGHGPRVELCENGFFLREYLPGTCLLELPDDQLSLSLPDILRTLDRICASGIFHTDPNAGNVILNPAAGRISLIDSEVPLRETPPPTIGPERRAYCHERLLYTAGLDLRLRRNAGPALIPRLAGLVKEFYGSAENPALAPERAADLLEGRAGQMEMPL